MQWAASEQNAGGRQADQGALRAVMPGASCAAWPLQYLSASLLEASQLHSVMPSSSVAVHKSGIPAPVPLLSLVLQHVPFIRAMSTVIALSVPDAS